MVVLKKREKCFLSLANRKRKIKTTLTFHLEPVRMTNIKTNKQTVRKQLATHVSHVDKDET